MDQELYYRYGHELISYINKTIRQELASEKCSLFQKSQGQNCSGDIPTGFDDLVNKAVLDFINLHKDELPLVVVSEETGVERIGNNPEAFILIDPIDGSNNVRPWLTPAPLLSISLAFGSLKNLDILGNHRALDFSLQKEIFADCWYYSNGTKAFYQGAGQNYQIKTSPYQSLKEKCVIGIDLDNQTSIPVNLLNLVTSQIIIRRMGSSILDLCQVAAGQYDAYVSLGKRLKVTDVCQPYHLLHCAGGSLELKAYLDGQYNSELLSSFLYAIILEREGSLLERLKFNVLAAGTKELAQEAAKICGF